ncbi:unnamed protein product [Linum tenue]|uniref:Uncharacterized protein n=1 Tax=Linum tenue TaxID=586396 RepID=A0AAV0LDW8_9ROSI|nr:unnamed protein product [Linum tenue]
MQRADDSRRSASFCQIKLCKLKVRIGKRLKKLRKGVVLSMSAARLRIYRMITIQWKRLFGGRSIVGGGGGVLPAAAAVVSIFPKPCSRAPPTPNPIRPLEVVDGETLGWITLLANFIFFRKTLLANC